MATEPGLHFNQLIDGQFYKVTRPDGSVIGNRLEYIGPLGGMHRFVGRAIFMGGPEVYWVDLKCIGLT
jgi:hypothetical protein